MSYRIPFPTNYLSLNTPKSQSTVNTTTTSPKVEPASHNFLSNRPAAAAKRHASISSVSSSESMPSPPTNAVDTSKQSVPTFLALNSKFTPPNPTSKESTGDKGGFLSNRH